MDDKKLIELHAEETPRRRVVVDARCSVLDVPVLGDGSFGSRNFMASGLKTDDGVEIWTPQAPRRQ